MNNDISTKVTLSGWTLDNPIIPASGCFGYGKEFAEFYDINILGSFSMKGTTPLPRFGNPTPRIAECTAGLINSVGLQNPGIDAVVNDILPNMDSYFSKKVIANISGFSIEDFVTSAQKLDSQEKVAIIEVNISCPNVHNGGMAFGTSAESAKKVAEAVRKATSKPIYIKLSPNVTSIVDIAKACCDGGADGLSLVNTLMGMRIDLRTHKPIIANVAGGFSGPAIFPVALKMVYDVCKAVDVPVIGMGGISSARDAVEMMLAGADAVQVGAANLVNPFASRDIILDLPNAMKEAGIKSFDEIKRSVRSK